MGDKPPGGLVYLLSDEQMRRLHEREQSDAQEFLEAMTCVVDRDGTRRRWSQLTD